MQRKNLSPAFHFRHIKELYPIFWAKSPDVVHAIQKHLKTATESNLSVEIGEWGNRATLDIIGVAGMTGLNMAGGSSTYAFGGIKAVKIERIPIIFSTPGSFCDDKARVSNQVCALLAGVEVRFWATLDVDRGSSARATTATSA